MLDYGFNPAMMPLDAQGTPARVTAVHRDRYELICEYGICSGKLKTSLYYSENIFVNEAIPAVGDFVLINYSDGDSQIIKTLERKSLFSRTDPSEKLPTEQAVAANFDYVFIIQALNQGYKNFNINKLERYLTAARQSGALPVIILNKADLTDDCAAYIKEAEKAARGVSVYAVSAKTGLGLDALAEYIKPGKTLVFLGSSGVGKSSLVNAVAGEIIMDVSEVREGDGKGRHTTTHRQLIMLSSGVMIIDTPGMRSLGMWDVSDGLSETFDDVEQYLGNCKFSDCGHKSEPGCAIKIAIESGDITRERWNNYLQIKSQAKFADSKSKAAYLRTQQEIWKKWGKQARNRDKAERKQSKSRE